MSAFEQSTVGHDAAIHVDRQEGATVWSISGRWDVEHVEEVDRRVRQLDAAAGTRVVIDGSALERLDTAGALVLSRARGRLEQSGCTVELRNLGERERTLLESVSKIDVSAPAPARKPPYLLELLETFGRTLVEHVGEYVGAVDMVGRTLLNFLRAVIDPRRLRWTSMVHHFEQAGLNAVPISALLCFLIGLVIAYIGIDMLNLFGAGSLTVNVVGYAFLRELGVLLVAIIVAGRSGSAFTAQIGSMKGHDEIDAMRTLGLDPNEILVLPRVIALVLVMPILVLIGNVVGLLGGSAALALELDMERTAYWSQLQDEIEIRHFLVGMIKAPIFGFLIGIIGCFQGFMVAGSAESVGERTTRSVVHSIFAVIVVDAFFAIYFMKIGW